MSSGAGMRVFVATARAIGAVALAAVAGCASLGPMPARLESSAYTDTADTRLGQLARSGVQECADDESGFRLLATGDFAFDARLALLRRAERSIDVQYYLVQRDGVGLKFLRELHDAAQRGVRVRLLVDDLYMNGGDEVFGALAALPNVEVRLFNPLPARGDSLYPRIVFSMHEFGRINHRMHNKLFVVDNAYAVMGGRNMADEYFMRDAHANFIDLDVITAGPVVPELSRVFDTYWNSAYAYPVASVIRLDPAAGDPARRFAELSGNAAPDLQPQPVDPLGQVPVEQELQQGRLALACAPVKVFADSPTKVDDNDRSEHVMTVTRNVLHAFDEARTEIRVASPYFIPGREETEVLDAAMKRGVRVRVLTNGLGSTDEKLVYWRYAGYRRELLRSGIDLYELGPDLARKSGNLGTFGKSFARLHAKVAIIDSKFVFVGSMNLDPRSAWANTELGLLIDSPRLARQILDVLQTDRNASLYRLRLAKEEDRLEWIATDSSGQTKAIRNEPDSSWFIRLKLFFLQVFMSEDLL